MNRCIIDVREPLEYRTGHVPGAINIPPATMMVGIPPQLADIPKSTEIVLYCVSGARSNTSMHLLKQYGFTNLVNGINKHHVLAKYPSQS